MGFGYIFTGFIFLSNPNINIFDIMPDFIGYALILFGLSRLRDLAPAIADSMRGFMRLFIFSLLKTAILIMIAGLPDQGYLLVFAFVFTLAEVAFMLSAFSNFFDGLFFVGTMYDGTEMVKHLTSAKVVTVLFVFMRGVFTLLPELIYLYVTEDFGYMLAEYKGVLNILSVFIVLIAGIVWLVHMRRFYKVTVRDSRFISNMNTYYNEYIKPNYNLFLKRRMKYALTLFAAGFLLLPDLYIDGIDYLPDPLGLLLILAALIIIAKYMKEHKLPVILCAVTALLSAGGWYYIKIYADRYYAFGVSKNMESYRMYLMSIAVSAAEAILLIFLLIVLTRYFLSLAKDHTGRETESTFASIAAKDEHQRKVMRAKIIAFTILGILSALSSVAYTVCLYLWPEYWMVNLAVSIIWIMMSSKLFYDLGEEIEHRYM